MALPYHTASKEEGSKMNSITLLISLYLFLLTFFVLLNTIANHDREKSTKAVVSVNQAFDGKETPVLHMEKPPLPALAGGNNETYISGFRRYLAKNLPLLSLNVKSDGEIIQAVLPSATLFEPGKAQFTAQAQPILAALARRMSKPVATNSWLAGEWILQGNTGLAIKQAAMLGEKLIQLGANPEHLSIGLADGGEQTLTLSFTLVNG